MIDVNPKAAIQLPTPAWSLQASGSDVRFREIDRFAKRPIDCAFRAGSLPTPYWPTGLVMHSFEMPPG